ncbi:hypothetical protein F5148DRAFT_735539 [Russula earlei]|uniref:Uncharacterized protein n=1 Tax=Russula earlei TaxID=71964 RepID=A0ACC0UDL2_9AGAM|nr:hypothetical protein F5148DRAFT_735539 [Russula earlei]
MAPRKKRYRHTVSKYFPLTTIDTLPDDILLEVFDRYRLVSAGDWSRLQGWYKLAHTCRRWRRLVFASSLRLSLQLRCTFGTPVVDMISHFLPYPLVLDYGPRLLKTWTTEDEHGLLFALQLLSRVKEIMLSASLSTLTEMTAVMVEAAPMLEHLTLHSQSTELVLPKSFLNGNAPQLRHLILTGVSLAGLSPLLSSSTSLVSLVLERVPSRAYFSPDSLIALIRSMPHLHTLSIGFLFTIPRPGFGSERLFASGPMIRVTLPALTQLIYRGVSAYIEALLARIQTPLIQDIDITLFNQLTLRVPSICRFIRDLETFRPTRARIHFAETSAHLVMSLSQPSESPDVSLSVSCPRLDFQVSAMAQICSCLSGADTVAVLLPPVIEELTLGFHQGSPPEEWHDEVDPALWRALFAQFWQARSLRIHVALVGDFERALRRLRQEATDEGPTEPVGIGEGLDLELLLPKLRTLVLLHGDDDDALASASKVLGAFIDERNRAGLPINVVTQDLSPLSWRPRSTALLVSGTGHSFQ